MSTADFDEFCIFTEKLAVRLKGSKSERLHFHKFCTFAYLQYLHSCIFAFLHFFTENLAERL